MPVKREIERELLQVTLLKLIKKYEIHKITLL